MSKEKNKDSDQFYHALFKTSVMVDNEKVYFSENNDYLNMGNRKYSCGAIILSEFLSEECFTAKLLLECERDFINSSSKIDDTINEIKIFFNSIKSNKRKNKSNRR